MANAFTQIYIHGVFSVRGRASLIRRDWKEELHKYITGIVQNKRHKMLAVNSEPDHIHIFVGMKPDEALSDLVRDIKANSSRWINEMGLLHGRFEWQQGYGAFSYSHSQVNTVVTNIRNQQEHHRKKSFHQECVEFLKNFDVPYDEKYVFDLDE